MRTVRLVVFVLFAMVLVSWQVQRVGATPQCRPFGDNVVACDAVANEDPEFCGSAVVDYCDGECNYWYGVGVSSVPWCENSPTGGGGYTAYFWCECSGQ